MFVIIENDSKKLQKCSNHLPKDTQNKNDKLSFCSLFCSRLGPHRYSHVKGLDLAPLHTAIVLSESQMLHQVAFFSSAV